MKEIGKILLYLLGTILLGALLAPPLFWIGQHFAAQAVHHGWITYDQTADALKPRGTLRFLFSDFNRYFDRTVLLAAFALLWPLVRSLRIENYGEDLGLRRARYRWRHLWIGFGIAFFSIALLGVILIADDVYYLKADIPWSRIAWLPVSAAAVAVLEELLFRGAIQGVVQRSATDEFAIVFVALLFAAIHFIKPPEESLAAADVRLWSGFALIPQVFWQFEQPRLLLWGFTTIFLVGLILGYARFSTRALWLPIGLHAGWTLSKLSFGKMTRRDMEWWPWFGTDILYGLGPVILLLATGFIIWLWLHDPDRV